MTTSPRPGSRFPFNLPPLAAVAGEMLLVFIVMAVLAPWLSPFDPARQTLLARLKPPGFTTAAGAVYWLGTDEVGRDLLSRIIYGARISLLVAILSVTVSGTLRVTHAVAKRMSARRAGVIVNLMGDSGRVGESGLLVTATTRASTVGLTKSLAKELARFGIRANCVSLGLVQTERLAEHAGGVADERMQKLIAQYPLRRLGRADDVTPMVLLLASPLSSWTTGQVVSINGGYAMP